MHPGDNLYTTSVLALDPDTGKIKTHFQYHQNDSWDWDEVEAPILVDLERDGRTVQEPDPSRPRCDLLGSGAQSPTASTTSTGWPYVYTDVWKGIEQETGRPIVDPEHKPVLGKKVEFCPSLWGGKDWPSAAYSPKTNYVYVPANENFCGGFTGEKVPLVPGQLWLGTKPEDIGLKVRAGADSYRRIAGVGSGHRQEGLVAQFPEVAIVRLGDGDRGRSVFAGGTNDRNFRAFDAKTGEVLWEQKTNSGIVGMPVAYEVDGTQYIAVQSGWGVDAQRIQDALVTNNIGIENNVPQGGVVWVFAVKK